MGKMGKWSTDAFHALHRGTRLAPMVWFAQNGLAFSPHPKRF